MINDSSLMTIHSFIHLLSAYNGPGSLLVLGIKRERTMSFLESRQKDMSLKQNTMGGRVHEIKMAHSLTSQIFTEHSL